jgi:hypothetical protein
MAWPHHARSLAMRRVDASAPDHSTTGPLDHRNHSTTGPLDHRTTRPPDHRNQTGTGTGPEPDLSTTGLRDVFKLLPSSVFAAFIRLQSDDFLKGLRWARCAACVLAPHTPPPAPHAPHLS